MSTQAASAATEDSSDLFEPVSFETWRAAVQAELKGVPFEKKLVTKTPEGIDLEPLYTAKDSEDLTAPQSFPGFSPFLRGSSAAGYVHKPWDISQEIAFSSTLEFNTAARNSLDRGLTALNIVLDQATRNGHDPDWAKPGDVGAGGLSIATLDDLQRALEGVDLEHVSLFIRSGSSALPVAAMVVALALKRGTKLGQLRGCIEMDPLGVLSHEGVLPQSLAGAYREMAELTRWAYTNAPQLQTICIHARAWHESGGTAVQELAFSMATAVDYFRAMHERQIPISHVAPRIRLAYTIGSDFFMEIAKLRAARMLWGHLIKSLGGNEPTEKLTIHARTSLWNKTRFDPWVNILRATTEGFSAILGGCDSLQIGAFDETLGAPDELSRRLARNTQLILQKECDLTHVVDPLGGSYYVEHLTDELAKKSWSVMQDVEKQGGMAKALESGFVQKSIAEAAGQKEAALASRRRVLVGTTQYANPDESPIPKTPTDPSAFERRRRQQIASYRTHSDDFRNAMVMEKLSHIVGALPGELLEACTEAVFEGATLGEVTRSLRIQEGAQAPITPVKIRRAAEPFETLRARVEEIGVRTGRRPLVFLATLGLPKEFKARADFAKSFFQTAGFAIDYPNGFGSVEDAVKTALASGALATVICSTDEIYPRIVSPLVKGLKSGKPDMPVILAGYPSDQVEAYREAGIDDFIYLKANALEIIDRLLRRVGSS